MWRPANMALWITSRPSSPLFLPRCRVSAIALIILFLLVFVFKRPSISGFFSPEYVMAPWSLARVWDMLTNIWPVLVIAGLGGVAHNMRVMRGNLLDVLGAQFVTTARSKGLKEALVMTRHAVPNALHPIVAYQGTVLPYMMAGELEAAIVLNLPTLGPLFYDSLVGQDIYIAGALLLDLRCTHRSGQPALRRIAGGVGSAYSV